MLDLVFEGHTLGEPEAHALRDCDALGPQTLAFVASAFDRGMTEQEWRSWQAPPADPQLQAAVRSLWLELIVPAFAARYAGSARPPLHQQRAPVYRSTRAL
jgi:hypothetical protein